MFNGCDGIVKVAIRHDPGHYGSAKFRAFETLVARLFIHVHYIYIYIYNIYRSPVYN